MKNIVPMTLILLMFASVFANTAWIEMNENEMDGAADGRADDDVGILGILEPRATKTDTMTGELRNTVKAGDEVNFVVSVKNHGTNNVTEMNIEATIYLADGTVATDFAGNDLTWLDAVICDDAQSCPVQSLAAGAYLNGGSYSVRDASGAAIAWAAPLGAYTIAIELDVMSGDDDITNDEFTVDITVVNWYDIAIDLEWNPSVEQAEGAGPHDFTLTVSTDGSEEWSARSVVVDLMITGAALDTAVDGDGNDIKGTTTHETGTSQIVDVFFNESAPCDDPGPDNITGTADDGPCDARNGNGSRLVIDYQDSWTYSGTVTPDANANGGYQVEAALVNYTLYGAAAECQESGEVTIDNGPDGIEGTEDDIREIRTFMNICEVPVETDDNNSNNEDKITGFIGSYHNIGVSSLVIAQGYDSTGNGEATSMRGDQDEIDVGFSRLHAMVEHRGSSGTGPYDWEVTFVVTDVYDNNSVVATYTADECPAGVAPPYTHLDLGEGLTAQPAGYACSSHEFDSGTYKITATVAMVNPTNPDESSVDDSQTATVEARNHDPVISLSLTSEGDIVVGDIVSFDVSAFDAEDITGESLTYSWSRITTDSMSVDIGECSPSDDGAGGLTKGERTCAVPVDGSWATTLPVTVKVTDPHGGEASDKVDLKVWNRQVAEATAASDAVSISYDLTYMAVADFSITASDSAAIEGVLLGNSEEGADSVYVIDYAPVTNYGPGDVGSNALSITFPGSSTEDYSLWYQYPGQDWILLDGEAEQDGATNMKLEWVNLTSGTLNNGLLGIFNAAAGTGAVPANGVSNAIGVNMAGGLIAVQWTLENGGVDLLSGDKIQICSVTNANETCTSVDKDATQHLLTGTHGQVFDVTVSVINVNGANANVKTFTTTADAEVSPVPTTTFGSIANGSTAWTFTITTADAGNAVKLYVCWKDSTYEASQLTPDDLSCQPMDIADASVDITKPSVTSETVYHFSIFAEDSSGNVVALSDKTTQIRYGELDDPGAGTDTLDDDKSGTTGVPTWTWGVIIGIVVVAFGIGAFILSRGGEGGEGKEWDY
ncbi:MAG TPA: hypothetical protein EYQ85_04790 [Candidatus Poseidoniales archaeon]|jgi:hypothetical protein|nr:hypothetical protein [Candidatus Poseidoniales archaeon]